MFAIAVFFGVALLWTFPLARHLESHLLGKEIGDNVTSVWNFWWMRTALAGHVSPFYTSYLFAPVGVDLTLNAHTALPAFIGASVLGAVPLVAAHNLTLLAMVVLNGCGAYALAWRFTRDHGAAVIAGLIFSGSPYMAAHLHGHFNLVSAWTIPLVAIAGFELTRGSLWWAVLAGLLLGFTVYLDYYIVLYAAGMVLCLVLFAAGDWRLMLVPPGRLVLWLARVAGALAVVALTVVATIIGTGGFAFQLGALGISARDVLNPLQAFWILVAIYVGLRLGIRVHAVRRHEFTPERIGRAFIVLFASFLVAAAPVALNGFELIRRGEYVTQQYFWRSSPKGVDLATLVLASPFHPLWGDVVQRVYERVGIDPIESTSWLGVVPTVLAVWVVRRHRRSARSATSRSEVAGSALVRQWVFIGAVFFIWALGPHLLVWGTNTGMILPQALIRYVPLVNNARIPGRAMVVVYLALAMLAALATTELRTRWRNSHAFLVAVAVLIVADYLPAPFPLVALERPALYETLHDSTQSGVVCELPLGFRDGFGVRGTFDERTLFYQTIHGRPLVGGFVARLPKSVAAAYEADPLLADLLSFSTVGAPKAERAPLSPDVVAASLRANGIRWIVVDRKRASSRLVQYVDTVLPVTAVANDSERCLYLVNSK